ncbi:MAG: MerR family transcriptional regulator [Gammaproteobacteria bacterium]|nr:MerR family transcriptional regulator [Gammaproteobacteria bacterium]
MNIGRVTQLTGASPKAIRHYEAIGLIQHVSRNGKYRTYTMAEVNLIRLIRSAQSLGFKLSELVALTEQGGLPSWPHILALVDQKHSAVLQEIARLDRLREQLDALRNELQDCQDGDDAQIDLKDIDCEWIDKHPALPD